MAEYESNVFTEIKTVATEDQVWAGLTDFEKLPERSLWLHGVNKTWRWVKCRPPISKTQTQAG